MENMRLYYSRRLVSHSYNTPHEITFSQTMGPWHVVILDVVCPHRHISKDLKFQDPLLRSWGITRIALVDSHGNKQSQSEVKLRGITPHLLASP